MRKIVSALSFALTVLFLNVLEAATDSYKVLPASEIKFRVRNFGVTSVEGKFKEFTGAFQVEEKFEDSKANAEIKTASIETENEERDAHLKNADFFDVKTHPTMSFKSTGLKGSKESFELSGDLEIKKISKPVTLKCAQTKEAHFKCEGEIDRNHYGITHGATIGDRVKLELMINGAK